MKLYYNLTVIGFILLSCCIQTKHSELPELPVEINDNISFPLSEIAEDITSIELEITDKSLINPDAVIRFLITEDNIIVAETLIGGSSKVLVFNKKGKFIRSIGSRGQGPGEYNYISNVAFDDKNKRIFIVTFNPNKIICYHLDGKFLKESLLSRSQNYEDINYINDGLFLVYTDSRYQGTKRAKRILNCMDDSFQLTDSIVCWENYYERNYHGVALGDWIVKKSTSVYFYSPEVYPKWSAPEVKVLRDTLYRLENNQLVPELKLKFKNDGFDSAGDKIIDLYNIFRASRYVFAIYEINPNNTQRNTDIKKKYYFCYDLKTGKGYNMLDGFTDDINGIEKRVRIRPLHTDSDIFYYWHTNMKPDDREEPNPTLYVIKLKK